jgi:hypothetical protein
VTGANPASQPQASRHEHLQAIQQVRGSGIPGNAPDVTSVGSVTDEGMVTLVRAGDLELAVARVLGSPLDGEATLTGRVGHAGEINVLASLRRS